MAETKDETKLISPCSCGSRLISILYTETSHAHFNADGQGREDGHDIEEASLDIEHTWCRKCNERRPLTENDLKLIGEDWRL